MSGVTIPLPGGSDTITLNEVAWRGLRIERATASRWVRITIDSLVAKRVDVAITPSTTTEASSPTPEATPTDIVAAPQRQDTGTSGTGRLVGGGALLAGLAAAVATVAVRRRTLG